MSYKIYFGATTAIKLAAITKRGVVAGIAVTSNGLLSGASIAGGAICAPVAWAFVSVLFVAEAGINYRRYKKGKIDKKEMKLRLRNNGVGSLTGMAGAAVGATVGFLIGSAAFPMVGSVIGVILGGAMGGVLAKSLTFKSLALIDKQLAKRKPAKKSKKKTV